MCPYIKGLIFISGRPHDAEPEPKVLVGHCHGWLNQQLVQKILKIFEKFKYTKKRLLSLAFKFYCHKKRFLLVSDYSTVGTGTSEII